MSTPIRHQAGAVIAGQKTGGQFKAHERAAAAPPPAASSRVAEVELNQYRSPEDGALVVEIDSVAEHGRVRINLNGAPVYDDDPEKPSRIAPMPFGDMVGKSQTERLAALQQALVEHLKAHPDDAYAIIGSASVAAKEAEGAFPVVQMIPERTTDEEGWVPPQVINPRTGKPDGLISVDESFRLTELTEDMIDSDGQSITFDYDSSADYDGVMYVTGSDLLPVRLPAEWSEA